MKTRLLFLTLPLLLNAQAAQQQPDLTWVDNEVKAIKPPREGVPSYAIARLKDPFAYQLFLNQPETDDAQSKPKISNAIRARSRSLTLEAVFNKHTAMIDGKWYKKDDTIYGYSIQDIGYDAVWLTKKKKQLKLTLFKKNDKIKINAK